MVRIAPVGCVLGTPRVSTLEQDEALQKDALQAAGCDQLFVDKASGRFERRPARWMSCRVTSVPVTQWWRGDWTVWAALSGT